MSPDSASALSARPAPGSPTSYGNVPLSGRDFGLLIVQLGLIATLVWQFQIEEKRHLLPAIIATIAAFAIHAWLPLAYRRVVFVAAAAGCVILVLGVQQGAIALAIAAAFIGIAALPAPVWLRGIPAAGLTAACFWMRSSSGSAFWPVVGSMFMFRLIVYFHEVRKARRPPTLLETCSYFLLLPNAFFPLFPIVDLQTFQATYYNEERRRIYQAGIHWIVTGLVHLLLYRLIRYEVLPSPLGIRTLRGIAVYFAANYALYLRVSGHFHIICGMLHLFGFHLPRTHHNYFLASSFSDIWRRINIYFKDFMTKVFFYPVFFRARRWGDFAGVTIGVLCVFVMTWLAHSWQAFWLLGDFPLRMTDAVMWISVGGIVAVNAILDFRRASRSRRTAPDHRIASAAWMSLKTLLVFVCVCLFWARWTNREIFRHLIFLSIRLPASWADGIALFGVVAICVVSGVIWRVVQWKREAIRGAHPVSRPANVSLPFDASVKAHVLVLASWLVVGTVPQMTDRFPVIADFKVERLTSAEQLALIDGYYEQLNDQNLQASPLLGNPVRDRNPNAVDYSDMIQLRENLLGHELIPGWSGEFNGARISINRWGMRDRERSVEKPEGVRRIAFVGASTVMGFGVADDQTFASLLEDRWNARTSREDARFEFLNFGMGRTSPVQRRFQIEHQVFAFKPDLIVYIAHQDEIYSSTGRVALAAYNHVDLEDSCLDAVCQSAGISTDIPEAMFVINMESHHADILRCTYKRLKSMCDTEHVPLLMVYVPIPVSQELTFDPRIAMTIAANAGIECADVDGWWGRHPATDVLMNSADSHPNVLGHRLLADALDPILVERAELRSLPGRSAD